MKQKPLTRKQMHRIAANIADVYPGKKLLVLMPGDPLPDFLKPGKKRREVAK